MTDKLNVERLRALDEAATVGDLSTAERQSAEEIIECPICQGHGEVLAADYCNVDGKALGVQFYGIGSEFGAHEALWSYLRNAVPSILAMAEENARSEAHRNKLYDKVMAQVTEIGALKAETARLRDVVSAFERSAYPVCASISPRGYNWSEAYLDEALTTARAIKEPTNA